MIPVFTVLSPGMSLPLRIAGRPATFMVTTLKVPVVGAASVEPAAARATKRDNMIDSGGGGGWETEMMTYTRLPEGWCWRASYMYMVST